MDRLKKHEDELDFFARELESRRVLAGPLLRLPIALYACLCDYGRSFIRPLFWIVVTVLVGALLFGPHFYAKGHDVEEALSLSTGLSLANTFGIFGFRKELISPEMIFGLPGLLVVIAAFQTVLGAALFFLFGLALRNRLRMR
jgi:hypothetical protein